MVGMALPDRESYRLRRDGRGDGVGQERGQCSGHDEYGGFGWNEGLGLRHAGG